MSDQMTLFKGPRVSRITIGRLHNLGNYEHVRYEVTVDLVPGNSPAAVLQVLDKMLADIDPRCPVESYYVDEAVKGLKRSHAETSSSDREMWIARIRKHDEWHKAREAALKRFDELGGTKVYTDAKDNWDDDL